MWKAVLAAVVTLIIGLLVTAVFNGQSAFGILAAIAVMGAFIIYFNDKK